MFSRAELDKGKASLSVIPTNSALPKEIREYADEQGSFPGGKILVPTLIPTPGKEFLASGVDWSMLGESSRC